ncbi:carbohydrate kinase family protein [Janthinobacterium sp. SUN118]|uniref:carbohydrate kinase family protein n=1 Tax=Janthinobacterium sp. SUN118 TaxID=3004100 RepID=UPI0025AF3495|nr:carbohydrate kinase family protein [Janthinobacterium sp. SUN118]MDN2712250.1 carbohydrate kinase family protein [Janthinobacterium sp. SUN118]
MSTYDILVVGGAGIDTIVRVPDLQLPVADSVHVPPILDYVAHTGNGVALGCHALGLRCKFIDFIGTDAQGAAIVQRYKEAKLDFSHIVEPSGTRRSVNLVDPQGRRMSLYDGRHPADLRMPAAFYLPYLGPARHAHFSIMEWVADLFDDARVCGTTVSTDLHDWDGVNPHHRTFALRADLVFLSTAALGARTESVMRAIVLAGRAQAVIAMAGADGAYLLERGSDEVRHFPCAQLDLPVVDTNGAGDSFVAAFLQAWLDGAGMDAAMRRGAIAGAFACAQHGTHERFIGLAELHDLYQDRTSL